MYKKILFLFSILFLLNSCSSYQKPTFKELSSVKINIKHKFTKLSGTITFSNPNAESLLVNELYFDAFFNGNDVGSFTKKTDAIIPAEGQISMPFYIEINNEEFDTEINEIELNLKGYINGKIKDENISLSFNETKSITPNGKASSDDSEGKSKEEIKQEKKEQKKLEKEQKKIEEMKRKASKEINA